MFGGSENVKGPYIPAMQIAGATNLNGSTTQDRTNFFETVPVASLEYALFLESDRMGHFVLNKDTLNLQRGVVQNEKRQGDNQPYRVSEELSVKSTYPALHPYSHTVIGSMDDLNAASIDDLKTWFATYYGPSNATLTIDLFSRKVVGWSMRPDMHRSLVIDALEMGVFQRRPRKGELIFHSDRGSQYASEDFRHVLEKHGLQASMSRKGNCWDNAVTETLFGSLKVERLHGERFQTIRQARDAVLAWLLWYNQQRMYSTLNYLSPAEFESRWESADSMTAA
jgi:hypothetical protein